MWYSLQAIVQKVEFYILFCTLTFVFMYIFISLKDFIIQKSNSEEWNKANNRLNQIVHNKFQKVLDRIHF